MARYETTPASPPRLPLLALPTLTGTAAAENRVFADVRGDAERCREP